MKHMPWHVKGIDPEARQVARDAARRSGLSVGRWLNSLIIDDAATPDCAPPQESNGAPAASAAAAASAGRRHHFAAARDPVRATRATPAAHERRAAAMEEDASFGSIGRQIEEQIRALNARNASLHAPPRVEDIANALRNDLAELGNALRNAMPTSAIATLEREVRTLGERIEANRASRPDSPAAADLEFASLSHDIHALSEKLGSIAQHRGEPDIMTTLDKRLAEIANAIGRRPRESPATPATPAIPAIPANFDTIIKKLADQLESAQIPAAGPAALRSLERRIVHLADKLDASEARLGRIDGVERDIGDLLVQLKELRALNERKLAAIGQQLKASAAEAVSGPAEAMRRDVALLKENQSAAEETFEAVYGAVERVVDRLDIIEQRLGDKEAGGAGGTGGAGGAKGAVSISVAPPAFVADGPPIAPPAPAPSAPSVPSAMPASPVAPADSMRRPVRSDVPSASSLEPGSEARRMQAVAKAFDRIAASEAVNAGAGAKTSANPGDAAPIRANFVAAARRAARAVASEQPPAVPADKPAGYAQRRFRANTLLQRVGPRSKSVILGISAILLVLGALRPAFDLFQNPDGSAPPLSRIDDPVSPPDGAMPPGRTTALETAPPSSPSSPSTPSTPSATRNSAIFADETALRRAPASRDGTAAAPIFPAATPIPAPAPAPDTTGSLAVRTSLPQGPQHRDAAAPPAVPPGSPPRDVAPLPARIGGKALLDAAAAGEPGASYEIAIRFAEGRNVPQDLAQAAVWFDRAARSGLAVAQFRLGSMYQKGLGLKQDLQEAHRLYLAAADKGNAKAMHNLAVLYAEGLYGKPDYALASQWFRQAATFGLVDSQYNLALLYARGIGVDRDLTESYKWFALAAKGGDKDAAKERDEIAARLDPRSLESARQAVEAFVPERQPGEATDTKAPPGGWDRLAAAAPAKRKAVH